MNKLMQLFQSLLQNSTASDTTNPQLQQALRAKAVQKSLTEDPASDEMNRFRYLAKQPGAVGPNSTRGLEDLSYEDQVSNLGGDNATLENLVRLLPILQNSGMSNKVLQNIHPNLVKQLFKSTPIPVPYNPKLP